MCSNLRIDSHTKPPEVRLQSGDGTQSLSPVMFPPRVQYSPAAMFTKIGCGIQMRNTSPPRPRSRTSWPTHRLCMLILCTYCPRWHTLQSNRILAPVAMRKKTDGTEATFCTTSEASSPHHSGGEHSARHGLLRAIRLPRAHLCAERLVRCGMRGALHFLT